jgi:hypothetical protein
MSEHLAQGGAYEITSDNHVYANQRIVCQRKAGLPGHSRGLPSRVAELILEHTR